MLLPTLLLSLLPQEAEVSELQALVDAAKYGATIQLEARTYEIDRALRIHGRSKLTLAGQQGTRIVSTSDWDNVISIESSRDITLTGISATHRATPESCTGNVIEIQFCRDIRIELSELHGCGTRAVQATSVRGLELVGNLMHHNSVAAMGLEGCVDVLLEGNVLSDNPAAFAAGLDPGTGLVARHNLLDGEPWQPEGWSDTPPNPQVRGADGLEGLPESTRGLTWFWLQEEALKGLSRFREIETLYVELNADAKGRELIHLTSLPKLRKLTLVVSDGMRDRPVADVLEKLEGLEELHLHSNILMEPVYTGKFMGRFLNRRHREAPPLKVLTMLSDMPDIDADSLKGLAAFENLEVLKLDGLSFKAIDAELMGILAGLPKLRVLHLATHPAHQFIHLDADALQELAKMSGLESLRLQRVQTAQPEDHSWLQGLTALRELHLSLDILAFGAKDPDGDIAAYIGKMTNLERLEIDYTPTAEDLAQFAELKGLSAFHCRARGEAAATGEFKRFVSHPRFVELGFQRADPFRMEWLEKAWNLRTLSLEGCDLSGLDWPCLGNIPSLMEIRRIRCSGDDSEARREFEKLRPNLR